MLYLALEDNQRRLQQRLQKLSGEDSQKYKDLELSSEIFRINEGGLAQLEQWLAESRLPACDHRHMGKIQCRAQEKHERL